MTLNIPALSGTDPSSIENNFFVEATQYLYGLNIIGTNATTSDTQKANALWKSFLQKEGITQEQFLQEVGTNPTQRTSAQQKALQGYIESYKTFLMNQLQYVAESEKVNLPVTEQTKIIWSIYDIMILLMSTANKTQITDSDTLKVLTTYQKEYQKAVSRGFFYTGNPTLDQKTDPTISSNSFNDPSNYNLGYGNITMGEVFNYLLVKAQASPNTPVSLSIPSGKGSSTFSLTYNSSTQMCSIDMSLTGDQVLQGRGITTWTLSFHRDSTLANALDNMNDLFKNGAINMQRNSTFVPHISWPTVGKDSNTASVLYTYLGSDNDKKNLYALAVQTRAAHNRAIQTAIDSLKSKQDTLADRANQIQRLIDSSLNSHTQSAHLLQSIVSQLKTILSQVCK